MHTLKQKDAEKGDFAFETLIVKIFLISFCVIY